MMTVVYICILLSFFCVYMGHRNREVFRYRMQILDRVSYLAQLDIAEGKEWKWRYDQFNWNPSYDEMLLKFWRPLHSFYEDKSYLEPAP